MIHKLALVLDMEKIALPSRKQQLDEISRLDTKHRDMLGARGIEIPRNMQSIYDDQGEVIGQKLTEDMDNVRGNNRLRGKTKNGIKLPGASQAANSPLTEKAIIEANSPIANSSMKRLRHRTIGPAKRFWAGQGGLGGKIPNRLALLAGLGGLAAGAKAYSDSSNEEAPVPTYSAQPQPQPQMGYSDPQYPSQEQLRALQEQYYKAGSSPYVQDLANVPKPPTQPRVPSPGPSVSAPKLDSDTRGNGLLNGNTGATGDPGVPKVAMDDAIAPMLGVGAGGAGGYMLGKKVLSPMFEYQEKGIANKINTLEKVRGGLNTAKKNAPMTAAVAGAILLAALTAIRVRDNKRNSISGSQGTIPQYDPTGSGFEQYQGVQMGSQGPFYG